MEGDELTSQAACGCHADLLAQDGPDCELEAIPAAGSTQSRTLRHQGREHRIAGEMVVDGLDVGPEIEEAPHAGDDDGEKADVGEADADAEALPVGQVSDLDASHRAVHLDCAQVAVIVDKLDALNGASAQEAEYGFPVIRCAIAKPEGDIFLQGFCGALSSQGAGRPMEEVAKGLVESPKAAESCGHCNLCHGHAGFVDELLREENTPCLGNGDGGRSEVLEKEPPELALAQAKALCQFFHAVPFSIECAFCDESQGPRD